MLQDLGAANVEIDPLLTVVQKWAAWLNPTPTIDTVLALTIQRAKVADFI